jgi:hypothetical protein
MQDDNTTDTMTDIICNVTCYTSLHIDAVEVWDYIYIFLSSNNNVHQTCNKNKRD